MPAAIEFTEVKKRYRDHQVLNGISLEINAGEFVGLIGINGAGKTTLIKCLLDFVLPDSGSIRVFGVHHRDTRARERLAFLPEKFNPPYYLNGHDFLRYMADLYDARYSDSDVRQLLKTLDLDYSALVKPVRQYSKGMSQKLGLAACFLSGRELLIMDEPMSGLDPRARAWLKQYLLEQKTNGRTLFFSTHLLADVEVLADRIAVLHNGVVKYNGSIAGCYEKYHTEDIEKAYLNCIAE